MIIEFKGGPFDGDIVGGFNKAVEFMVAWHHPDRPVYGRHCCACCAETLEMIEYIFVGYEPVLRREKEANKSANQPVRRLL
jgi:hypothetical protein